MNFIPVYTITFSIKILSSVLQEQFEQFLKKNMKTHPGPANGLLLKRNMICSFWECGRLLKLS